VLFIFGNTLFSQAEYLDSLISLLKTAQHDTIRCDILGKLAEAESNELLITGYNDRKLSICESNLKKTSLSVRQLYLFKGYYASSLTSRAYVLYTHGDVKRTIELLHASLKLREAINDRKGVANDLNNLAVIYVETGDKMKGIEYLEKSLKIIEKFNDKKGMGNILGNIGLCYRQELNYEKALDYMFKSLRIHEEAGNPSDIAFTLTSIAGTYGLMKDQKNAIHYFDKGLKIQREIGDKNGEAGTILSIGHTYYDLKEFHKAIPYYLISMKLSEELGHAKKIKNASKGLFLLYKKTGNYKLALENYETYIKMNDSLNNESIRKASVKSQLKYEYEKQAAADSVAHAKESEIKNVQLQKQTAEIKAKKNQQYALFGGLGLVIIFAGFMFNRFKVTQKQKGIIELQKFEVEKQKHLVDEKQKEVIDSIRYAKRIQTAQLPNEKYIAKSLGRLMK